MNHRLNYLGLDWGKSKIGVALAHEETRLALAYGILPNDVTLFDTLGTLFTKEDIGTVVIGVHRNGAFAGDGEFEGEKLGKQLAERFQVTIAYQDEMFTSKLAQQNLIAQGEKHVSTHDDAEAARILLQSFLESAIRSVG
jgi:putative transcription antitermination factor YqgF